MHGQMYLCLILFVGGMLLNETEGLTTYKAYGRVYCSTDQNLIVRLNHHGREIGRTYVTCKSEKPKLIHLKGKDGAGQYDLTVQVQSEGCSIPYNDDGYLDVTRESPNSPLRAKWGTMMCG